MVERRCPDCSMILGFATTDVDEALRCSACHGIWIQRPMLRRLVSEGASALAGLKDAGSEAVQVVLAETPLYGCPECSQPLVSLEFAYNSGIILYECEACDGLWMRECAIEPLATALEDAHTEPRKKEVDVLAQVEFELEHQRVMDTHSSFKAWLDKLRTNQFGFRGWK